MSTVSGFTLCRLCLNKEELIYAFDDRLANGHQLRMCILLCTGVEVKEEDHVSKMVCHKCCSLAVKLYQYRQTALANDKALKEVANEIFEEPPVNKETIVELHRSILDNISQCKVTESVAQVYRVPLDDVSEVNNDDKVTKDDITTETSGEEQTNAHDTVKKIFQYFPTAIVPREILDANVLPSVPVDRDIHKYVRSEYEVIPADNSDGRVLKFKRKYPTTDVVKLAVKRPRSGSCSNCSSDSESSLPPVFKSRKKDGAQPSDASYSDCDSDVENGKTPAPTSTVNRTNSRPSRSKMPQNPLQFPDSDSDSETTKKPANTNYCEICDRTFYGWSQLKSHQRTHLKCIVCRIICDSQEDLEYHVKNICYKVVEYNQPYLALPKVDEDRYLLYRYRGAFDRYFQDIEDGVYGPTEPPPPPDPDYPLYHTGDRISTETDFIKTLFEKYKHLDNTPVVRTKTSQTRRPETHIKYYNRNQIVLQDMYRDLAMYKVPINVVVNPRVSAHISFASRPLSKELMEVWSGDSLRDIVVPQKDPTFFLRPKKPPPVTKHTVPKIPVKATKEKHPKLVKALTAPTSTSTVTVTTTTTTAGSTTEKTKSYNIAKLLSTSTVSQITVPKTVSLVTTVNQLKMPTRISNEVSLVPKQTVPRSAPTTSTAPIYANIMFRLPISTQPGTQQHFRLQQPTIQRQVPPQQIQPPPQQQQQQQPLPYVKEEPDIPQTPPAEITQIPPKILHQPPQPYSTMPFKLPTPPTHPALPETYLKQEGDLEDSLGGYTPPQMTRQINGPNMSYQNHMYRMPLSKPPPPHLTYSQQPYPTPPRYRAPTNDRRMNTQQYYSVNHHQNGMRYRSISGGNMMVLPNSHQQGGQDGSLLSQIPPPPSINTMPATHLLQSMNHISGNHRSPINHQMATNLNHPQQQNSMYMNQHNQHNQPPAMGKMSPISSIPSPIHSSPIDIKPLSSPINTMAPLMNNYNNNTYNNNPSLYDHSYADTYSNGSYSETYPNTSPSSSSTYLPPQQYIPPYSPHSHMDIDPFVDQMLQQAAGSNKVSLRVKQPWELNQT